MLPAALAVDTIVVVAPVLVDDRGTLVPDWELPPVSSVQVGGCSVQPAGSSEVLDGRQQVQARWRVWAPPDTPVTAYSAVVWMGERYQVDGEPATWSDPLGVLSHVAFDLVAWRG